MDDREKFQELVRQLGSSNEKVKNNAIQELLGILNPTETTLIEAWDNKDELVWADHDKLFVKIGKSAVPILIDFLKNGLHPERWKAAEVLGLIRDASAVPVLIDALKDTEMVVPENAARALVNIGRPAVLALVVALKNESTVIQHHATVSLKKILANCKGIDYVREFEDRLTEGFDELKKDQSKREIRKLEFDFAKWKMIAANKKNEFAGKKDILLPDKPKPPKKGQMFHRIRRVRNG
jgi:hypothetical protein